MRMPRMMCSRDPGKVRRRLVRLLPLLIPALWLHACADPEPDYRLLFGNDETRLAPEDMATIYALVAAMFPPSADGRLFEDPNCGDIDPQVEILDLNGDGVNEVFVHWGNACTSGMTGRSLSLFVKEPGSGYMHLLGFPAFDWTALQRDDPGWPDLRFGGPGFCFAVWTWTGGSYQFKCNLPQQAGGCSSRADVCP